MKVIVLFIFGLFSFSCVPLGGPVALVKERVEGAPERDPKKTEDVAEAPPHPLTSHISNPPDDLVGESLRKEYQDLIQLHRARKALKTIHSFLVGTKPSAGRVERERSIQKYRVALSEFRVFLTDSYIASESEKCKRFATVVRNINYDMSRYVHPVYLNHPDRNRQILLLSRLIVLNLVNQTLYGLLREGSEGGDRTLSIGSNPITCFGDWRAKYAVKFKAVNEASIEVVDTLFGRLSFEGYSRLFLELEKYGNQKEKSDNFYWYAGIGVSVLAMPASLSVLLGSLGAKAIAAGFGTVKANLYYSAISGVGILALDKGLLENPKDFSVASSKWDVKLLVAEDLVRRSLDSPQTYLSLIRAQVQAQYEYEMKSLTDKQAYQFMDRMLQKFQTDTLEEGIDKIDQLIQEKLNKNSELMGLDLDNHALLPSIYFGGD